MSPAKRSAPSRAATKRRSWAWRYRRVLFLVGLLGFTALAGALFLLTRVPLPPEEPPVETSFITDINGVRLATLSGGENRVLVSLDDVPEVVVDAVLATEDRNFFTHGGLDPIGIARATWADIRNKGALQGGSTITQQYVKNTYPDVGRERTLWRKLKEAVLAIKVERKFDKRVILERYLNTIYFGRGAYGIQAAARSYFGRDVQELTLREAAYLAGLIRAPERADAYRAPEVAAQRRASTLAAMRRNGMITEAEAEAVAAEPLSNYVVDRAAIAPTIASTDIGTQYFVDYVRRELVERYGEAVVIGGGLRVRTSLDLAMQAAAYRAVYGYLDRPEDPAGALVAVDDDGNVRAMVGGRADYTSKVNLAVGRAGGGSGRQAGSTFKPFLLAEVVREGYTVESALPGPARVVLPKANDGRDWPVSNYEDADFGGSVNLIDATRNSVNTVYAQLVTTIGPEKMAAMATDLGITTPLEPFASLVLGTQEVSVLEVAAAYSTLANRGVRVRPRVIVEVTTADGSVLYRTGPERERVLEREQADVVNFCLRQVVERGSGTGAQFGRPLAGKTGTTNDFGDAWFVGYTPKLTAAVWMGYADSNRPMLNVRGRRVNGGSIPATLFKRFMTDATEGMDTGDFPDVRRFPGKVVKGNRIGYSPDDAVDPSSTTTTTGEEAPATTSTTGPRAAPTTTTPPRPTTTTAPPPTTTAAPPPPPPPSPSPNPPPAPTTTAPP